MVLNCIEQKIHLHKIQTTPLILNQIKILVMKQLLSLFLSFSMIVYSGTSFSQITPTKGWEKFYGDDHDDNEMKSIIKDGDFIVVAGNYVNDDS